MSVRYVPVQWNPNKWVYDAVLIACIAAYILVFLRLGTPAADFTRPPDGAVLRMRAFGSCAFLMLTVILCIGPLARLDRRFLPSLYNRRHFGVLTAVVAATHGSYVLSWYFAFSPTPPIEAMLEANTSYGQLLGFPIVILGVIVLLILGVLAATSHDFWLAFLTPPVWKALHLLIYPAYVLLVAHVALGYLQITKNPMFALVFVTGAFSVAGLHLLAWAKAPRQTAGSGAWVAVSAPEDIADQRAVIVRLSGTERAAVFRNGGTLSAVSNACAHQGGPLGEGRIIDGCITCPWHGFQYRPGDGCSPEPFTEKIPTYRLKLENGVVMIDPAANPPGTPVEPLHVGEPG